MKIKNKTDKCPGEKKKRKNLPKLHGRMVCVQREWISLENMMEKKKKKSSLLGVKYYFVNRDPPFFSSPWNMYLVFFWFFFVCVSRLFSSPHIVPFSSSFECFKSPPQSIPLPPCSRCSCWGPSTGCRPRGGGSRRPRPMRAPSLPTAGCCCCGCGGGCRPGAARS